MLRLQQQLARYESDKAESGAGSSRAMSLDEQASWSLETADAWAAKLSRAQEQEKEMDNALDNASVSWKQQALQFLRQQRRLVLKLSRENAQLRDQLETRPSARDLAVGLQHLGFALN